MKEEKVKCILDWCQIQFTLGNESLWSCLKDVWSV